MAITPLIVAGVDTHQDTHYAVVISNTGEHLGAEQFPATHAGYRASTKFITCHGVLLRAGVEGTNSDGAGLSRHLRDQNVELVEVMGQPYPIPNTRTCPALPRTIDQSVGEPGVAVRAAIREMVKSAKDRGLALTGPDGLLKLLTKTVLETALDEEMTAHLG